LRAPLAGRRKFTGPDAAHGDGWRLAFSDDGGKTEQALDFALDDVRDARLVPVLDFKPRRAREAAAGGAKR
jgi:ribosome maturation factor RimP